MSDDKPLPEVLADAIANTAAASVFQLKKEMQAREQVMTYAHVKDAIRVEALAILTKNIHLFGSSPDGDGDGNGHSPAERIYAAYPRHIGKKSALKAITAALKVMPLAELLAKVQAYKAATDKWPAAERTFIPHPATWFNRGSYQDDPAEWERGGKPAAGEPQPQAASLGSLQLQLKRIEDEMEGILYPGGAAFKTIPTGEKLARFTELQAQRSAIKKRIEGFGR